MADELLSEQPSQETTATVAPETPVAVSAANETPSVAADVGSSSPASAVSPTWLENAKSTYGLDLGADEAAALQNIARVNREYQQLQQHYQQMAPYVQSYQQHAPQFSEWLRTRHQQAQPAPTTAAQQEEDWRKKHWNPPEYNPAWRGLLRSDEAGNPVALPGTPPDILPKYLAYAQYQNEFIDRWKQDPIKAYEDPMRHIAREEARKIAAEELSQYRTVQDARQFTAQHEGWLYERDQQGQVIRDFHWNPSTGQHEPRPRFNQWGNILAQEIAREHAWQQQHGIMDLERQKEVAMRAVQAAFLQAQGQAPPAQAQTQAPVLPPPTREEANQRFLQQNNGPSRRKGSGNAQPAVTPLSVNLEKQLLGDLKANGITNW